ncbi:myosin light chain kinase family member 4 isoform X5 [Kryptolebias marmoratus]|uniref:myosin light chain kinase family member 4 isoform X5 n=1 Tax=Kryptolebias marmoratus TaxID=37003 RepID=UPI0007F89F9C|nr:myosin light chain kinase family member 4 isoform X5 [Kryptolebias marmoratus]
MSSSLVNSLAKMYDPNPLPGRKLSLNASDRPHHDASLRCMESRMDSLSSQMEHLLNMQQTVLTRLDGLSQDVRGMGRDLASMCEEGRRGSGVEAVYRELRGALEGQGRRLDGVEKLLEGTQQVISLIGEVVKNSRLVELLFKQPGNKTSRKAKDDKDKTKQNLKGGKAQKKQKPQDSSDGSCLNESALQKQVEKLNRENSEHYQVNTDADVQSAEDAGSKGRRQEPAELILQGSDTPAGQAEDTEGREDDGEDDGEDVFDDTDEEEEEQQAEDVTEQKEEEGIKKQLTEEEEEPSESGKDMGSQESSEDAGAASKRCVTEEDLVKDDLKKSRVEDRKQDSAERHTGEASKSDQTKAEAEEPAVKEFMIESSPPPSAPFDHRIVTPKPHQIATYYTINRDEVLGGGRFGQVYKCLEKSSGLTLAAKIIKARNQKEKEVVRNEIQVMNQLNHANLIQLYAAFESRNDIVLVMEYVEGGELFDRIIDENYNLTELDTVLFIRQICEGLQYMHKNYILHLDLKPENILCVSRATNKIKIIDFGLARRYKPREKLRVNFGTPEFLAPEVINYEFVSFPTDMWSLGVITYMLLSGLSPFLGDDDNETLNNILSCQWNFEEEEFADISDEAKDFITRLLVKSKSWRMSATESLRHGWLSDQNLHYRLHQKKNKCHSSRVPPPES